jgi:hypothetical protein
MGWEQLTIPVLGEAGVPVPGADYSRPVYVSAVLTDVEVTCAPVREDAISSAEVTSFCETEVSELKCEGEGHYTHEAVDHVDHGQVDESPSSQEEAATAQHVPCGVGSIAVNVAVNSTSEVAYSCDDNIDVASGLSA